MPYIEPGRRDSVRPAMRPDGARNAGELNYAITVLIARYWRDRGPSYQAANDIVGALEGAKTEFQRRILAPYEDMKREQNGDVYE